MQKKSLSPPTRSAICALQCLNPSPESRKKALETYQVATYVESIEIMGNTAPKILTGNVLLLLFRPQQPITAKCENCPKHSNENLAFQLPITNNPHKSTWDSCSELRTEYIKAKGNQSSSSTNEKTLFMKGPREPLTSVQSPDLQMQRAPRFD